MALRFSRTHVSHARRPSRAANVAGWLAQWPSCGCARRAAREQARREVEGDQAATMPRVSGLLPPRRQVVTAAVPSASSAGCAGGVSRCAHRKPFASV